MPWPLEHIVRQYVGFSDFVCREYTDLIEYNERHYNRHLHSLVEKRSARRSTIAQWRWKPNKMDTIDPYIYHFRYIFDKNWNLIPSTEDCISWPPKLYIDIVKEQF